MSKRLKRTWAGVLLAAVVLAAGTTGVFAAGQGGGKNYTDANQDASVTTMPVIKRMPLAK